MLITAHSGFDGTQPNSMDYIKHTSLLPVDALEVDVRRGLGGNLVLSHDPVGTAPLVKLDQAFQFLADTKLRINCDLKEYGLEESIYRCAERNGIDQKRIILTGSITDCKTFLTMNSMRTVFVNAEELIPNLYEIEIDEKLFDRLIYYCRTSGYNIVNVDYRVCSEKLIKNCFEAGIMLSLWTVDDEQALIRLIPYSEAIFNVTTNVMKIAEAVARINSTDFVNVKSGLGRDYNAHHDI